MSWANYVEDLMIRRRLHKSKIPGGHQGGSLQRREFHLSSAIEWNYDVRKRRMISELSGVVAGYDKPRLRTLTHLYAS